MISSLKNILKGIMIFFKYRKVNFKYLGKNVNYKFINSKFHYSDRIVLEDNVQIGENADIDGRGGLTIKHGTITAKNVSIITSDHYFEGEDLKAIPFDNKIILKPVVINEYVWIGRNVLIMPGVTIGKGVIIGAGSVIVKDIPDYAIAVGNPAVIKRYRDQTIFKKLEKNKLAFLSEMSHEKIEISV